MLPQWPWVVWATTLQFPSNDEAAIADGMEQIIAEAAARASAQIRFLIMGSLLRPAHRPTRRLLGDSRQSGRRIQWPAARATPQHAADIREKKKGCQAGGHAAAL